MRKYKVEYDKFSGVKNLVSLHNTVGGKFPTVDADNRKNKFLPMNYSDYNIYFDGSIIYRRSLTAQNLNITRAFTYELVSDIELYNSNLSANDLPDYVDEDIIINSNTIPFHTLLLQNKFDIVTKLYKLIISKYNKIEKQELKHVNTTFREIFNLHRETNELINVSSRPNLLNNFIFINKFRELLELLFDSRIDPNILNNLSNKLGNRKSSITNLTDITTIIRGTELELYNYIKTFIVGIFESEQNFVNFNDFIYLYSLYTNVPKANKETVIIETLNRISNYGDTDRQPFVQYFIEFIMEINKFIKFNVTLNKIQEKLSERFNTKLSHLFYCSYIGHRLFTPSLSIGHLSNVILPINVKRTVENLLDKPIDDITANPSSINYLIYKNSGQLPEYYKSGMSIYRDTSFPNCVENTTLEFIRTLAWDSRERKLDTSYLPDGTIDEVKRLLETPDLSGQELNDRFSNIVSDKPLLKDKNLYKQGTHEIISSIDNFMILIGYLFNIEVADDSARFVDDLMRLIRNPNITEITINNNTVTVNTFNSNVSFLFGIGHATFIESPEEILRLQKYIYSDVILILSSKYVIHSILGFKLISYVLENNTSSTINSELAELLRDKNLYFIDNPNDVTKPTTLETELFIETYDDYDFTELSERFFALVDLLEPEDQYYVIINGEVLKKVLYGLFTNLEYRKMYIVKQFNTVYLKLIKNFNENMILGARFSSSDTNPELLYTNLLQYIFMLVKDKNLELNNMFAGPIISLIKEFFSKLSLTSIKTMITYSDKVSKENVISIINEYHENYKNFIAEYMK